MRVTGAVARDEGAATLEMALLLPFLVFLFAITVDFGRVYYYSVAATSCARSGAIYAADRNLADKSPFDDPVEAALADAADFEPAPTITVTDPYPVGTTECVRVQVEWQFHPIIRMDGIAGQYKIVRSVVLAKTPDLVDDGGAP